MDFKALFNPRGVAVIGASDKPGKLGGHVMKSLMQSGFQGRIIPVNPSAGRIMGLTAATSMDKISEPVDLAVIVVPSASVLEQVRVCIQHGVKGVVLITAGFKEIDDPIGRDLQVELAQLANQAGLPIIGPNTFGLVNLWTPLNASFTPEFSLVPKGGVAILSQSGGVAHLLANLAINSRTGLSKIVGLGNRLNVDFADLLPYLSTDPECRAIALYVEGIDEPRRLMDAASKISREKPIIVYKVGQNSVADAASRSHTGSLAGPYPIYLGAFRQSGQITVESAEALLDGAKALAGCPLPKGPKVAILSGQAGPGLAAVDVCSAHGLEVGPFSPATQDRINQLLPPLALRTNPVDMGPAWYNGPAIRGVIRAVLADPEIHGILILMMYASANRGALDGLSELLMEFAGRKPILTCLSSPPGLWDEAVARLEDAGAIVNYSTPEKAAAALGILNQRRMILAG